MIFEWFVDMAVGLVTTLVTAITPDLELGAPALTGAFTTILTMNAFFPLTESLAAGLMVMTVSSLVFSLKIVQMLIAHVPGIGGSGG